MRKIIFALGLLVLACWAFRALDYHFATRLKGPIYVTGLSGTRFIRDGMTDIEYEDANGDLKHLYETLDSIDLATLQALDSAQNADGTGRVDVRYRDKNYEYTIHDGEEKYVVRHVNGVASNGVETHNCVSSLND